MKHLKSSGSDLRELFERSISVKSIAEPLASFDTDCMASQVLAFMGAKNYDIVGVRQDGLAVGYARQSRLSNEGKLGDYREDFRPEDVFEDTEPLLSVFKALKDKDNERSRVFVQVLGKVGGIVTRGDLQKAPVRMWLFGLISLIEMQLLRIIRKYYPDDSWRQLITDNRLKKAESIQKDRHGRNVEIDLADCLQLCDKRDIVLKDKDLWDKIWIESKEKLEDFLKELERLRDDLAHAQDIITGRWPKIVDLADNAEQFLQKCESYQPKGG